MDHKKKAFKIRKGCLDSSAYSAPAPVNAQQPSLVDTIASSLLCSAPSGEALYGSHQATEQRTQPHLNNGLAIHHDHHQSVLRSLAPRKVDKQQARWGTPRPMNAFLTQPEITVAGHRNIGEIWRIIRGLAGGRWPEFDLQAELHALRSIYEEIFPVQITLELEPEALELLTQEEEREILAIVRETLSNYARDFRASHTVIALHRQGGRICFCIDCDGKGFALGNTRTRGFALAAIRARARKIGGVPLIRSGDSQGIQISIEFPLESLLVSA